MTIREILDEVDELKPNQITSQMKTKWLSDLDARIFSDVIQTHEKDEGTREAFTPYNQNGNGEEELLIPDEYGEIYRWYLEMQIDLAARELARYENSMTLFNVRLAEYKRKYNRDHMPLQACGAWIY